MTYSAILKQGHLALSSYVTSTETAAVTATAYLFIHLFIGLHMSKFVFYLLAPYRPKQVTIASPTSLEKERWDSVGCNLQPHC